MPPGREPGRTRKPSQGGEAGPVEKPSTGGDAVGAVEEGSRCGLLSKTMLVFLPSKSKP